MRSLVDLTRIRETSGGDRVFERELIQLYLEDTLLNIEKIKQANKNGDSGSLKKLAHTLKGSSASVGAILIQEKAEALEREALEGNSGNMAALFEQLERAYEETGSTFQEFLDTIES